MVWYFDALLGLIISLSFIVGGALYIWSREEIDVALEKLNSDLTKKVLLVLAGVTGLGFAWFSKTPWKEEISLPLFLFGLIISSISFVKEDNKEVIKYSLVSTMLFLVFFFMVFVIRS